MAARAAPATELVKPGAMQLTLLLDGLSFRACLRTGANSENPGLDKASEGDGVSRFPAHRIHVRPCDPLVTSARFGHFPKGGKWGRHQASSEWVTETPWSVARVNEG